MKPSLFNTEMICAILEDRKTVTRRVVKLHNRCCGFSGIKYLESPYAVFSKGKCNGYEFVRSPYRPGDILYVRETFKMDYLSNIPGSGRIRYKADDTYADFTFKPDRYEMMRRAQLKPGWRPNGNMPREAARIFLRVTDVRVERLQDCGDMEAKEEGCTCCSHFIRVWDSTIKPAERGLYGWEANPWVWVIAFERISKEEAMRNDL